MAGETDVVVPDETVVEVALDGAEPPKKEAGGEVSAEPPVEPKKSAPRIRPGEASPDKDAHAALQQTLESERRLRTAAEQNAANAQQQAVHERNTRLTREQELDQARQNLEARALSEIDTGISNATKEIASTQKELSSALAEGNFERVAEVQTRLSRASAALDRYEAKKADYETSQQSRTTTEGAVTGDQQATQQASPFDRYIGGMEPAAQTWLRAHPDCAPPQVGGKADMNSKMMRGHYDALAQGFPANSENYFRVIEESTGFREPVKAEEDEEAPPPPKQPKKQASPSAPPSREPPGSPPTGNSRTVRLTLAEQEAARFSFPNLKTDQERFAEYAKNKVALDSEGKLGRTSH